MKSGFKTIIRILVALCYLISISFIAIYFVVELNPNVELAPSGRVILLLSICILTYIGSILSCRVFGLKQGSRLIRHFFWLFFILYLQLLLTLTEFDQMFGRNISSIFHPNSYITRLYLQNNVNLVPFKTIFEFISALFTHELPVRVISVNLLGNICAFMPFAFFLPLFFKSMNVWKKFIICMVLIVITIEILQLVFMTGSCDIDDLILNVSGAWIMYGILKISKIQKFIKALTMQDAN